jgi:hypothetical protein
MLLAGAAGCSAIVDPDVGKLGGPPPPACQPGEAHGCACIGGKTGFQVCNSGGSYNQCECGMAGTSASAGTGGAAGTGAKAGAGGAAGTNTGGAGRGSKK